MKGYIELRLEERWLEWFSQSMGERRAHVNSDFHPLAVFFNLSYWNSLFSPYLTEVFNGMSNPALLYPLRKSFLLPSSLQCFS
jgi:hypothetical protein